jgi:hypothetical protein
MKIEVAVENSFFHWIQETTWNVIRISFRQYFLQKQFNDNGGNVPMWEA